MKAIAVLGIATTLLIAPELQAAARIRLEIENALVSLNERGYLGAQQEAPLTLSAPSRERWELGAVLDLAEQSAAGLPVLAVTPGAAADRLGLRQGDRLLAINDVRLRGGADAPRLLVDALGARQGQLSILLARQGASLELAGSADSVTVPAYTLSVAMGPAPGSSCARISVNLRPPVSQQLFPVVVHTVNGRLAGPLDATTWVLAPGRHRLRVSEAIDGRRFNATQNRDRELRARRREHIREWEIEVEAGMTYRLGARLLPDRSADIEQGTYWEPVIWRSFGAHCRAGGVAPLSDRDG